MDWARIWYVGTSRVALLKLYKLGHCDLLFGFYGHFCEKIWYVGFSKGLDYIFYKLGYFDPYNKKNELDLKNHILIIFSITAQPIELEFNMYVHLYWFYIFYEN